MDYFSYFQQLTGQYYPSSRSAPPAREPTRPVPLPTIPSHISEPDSPISKLRAELQVISSHLSVKLLPLRQQAVAVCTALNIYNAGSVLLFIASMSYIVVQVLLSISMFLLKLVLAICLFVVEIVWSAVRRLGGFRQQRLVLPCSVQSLSDNRQVGTQVMYTALHRAKCIGLITVGARKFGGLG